jgi:hypothetical protein
MFNPFGIGILGAQRNPFAPQPLQVPMPLQAVPMQQLPGPGMTPAPLQLMPRVGGGTTIMPGFAQVPQAASPQFGPPGQAPAPLKPLGPMRAPAVRRSEGFGGLDPQTWFDIAGGFMSGAQNNDWSQALFGVGGALNARQGRRDAQADRQWRKQEQGMALTAEQRARAGEQRTQAQHKVQMTEAQYIQQLRADAQRRWDAARADPNLTPEQRRRLEAVGPEGYADAVVSDYQMQVQAQQAEVEFNRQAGLTREGWQVQSRENARDRAARSAEIDAAAALRSPYFAQPNARDQQTYQSFQQAAQSGQTALSSLQRARALLVQLGEMGAMGQPIDAAQRMRIGRLIGDNQEARALYEQFTAEQWPLIVQSLQGLAPVSNIEISMAERASPNADMTLQGALGSIDALIARTQRTTDMAYAGLDWGSNSGSYSTGRDAQGRTWADVQRGVFEPQGQQTPNIAPANPEGAMRGSGAAASPAPPPTAFGRTLGVAQVRAITGQDPSQLPNGYEFEIAGVGRYRVERLRAGTRAVRVD